MSLKLAELHTADSLSEREDGPHSDEVPLYVCYTMLLLLYQPFFVYLMIISIRKIAEEKRSPVLDLFKLAQYYCLVGFLITRQIFFFLQYVPLFEFFYDPCSFVVLYFLSSFEWVNLACWL